MSKYLSVGLFNSSAKCVRFHQNFKVIWIMMNMAVFTKSYQYYTLGEEYFYLRLILGKGLGIARGSAAVIMVNCFLVLLPVCQSLNLLVHKMLSRFSKYIIIHWFKNLEKIHITAAVVIFISSVIHSISHVVNAHNYSKNYYSQYPEINWAVYKNQSSALLILTSVAGLTGIAMLLVLCMMFLLSQKSIRNVDHEIFGNSHLTFFLIFFLLYIIHPFSRALKKQTNTASHQPGCEILNGNIDQLDTTDSFPNNNSLSTICQTRPIFHHMDQVHLYALLPLIVYLTRLVFNRTIVRRKREFLVDSIERLPHSVYRLNLYSLNELQKHFIILPGQYSMLQCPRVSHLEWHPFSIVSTENKFGLTKMTFLVRATGDWTNSVCDLASKSSDSKGGSVLPFSNSGLRMKVDGPFFSPLENMLLDGVALCVAGGIGITPFAALLNHMVNEDVKKMCRPFKLHMIWVIKYTSQIQWISGLLVSLNEKLTRQRQLDRFNLEIFLTRETSLNINDIPEKSHFLLQKLKLGRPEWFTQFKKWQIHYERGTLPVYICGPNRMEKQVKKVCRELGRTGSGCKFRCISETFA